MAISVFDMQALQHNWSTDETRAIFEETSRVAKWMEVEAALARAQAELGIIPQEAADDIVAHCKAETIDIPKMAAETRRVKHALVPALKQLQAACSAENGQWVHYGATTQDVIDTGMVLQIRDAHALFLRDIKAVGRELARLAREHRDTIMAGRTHGVLALPITFGHKCAIWLDELSRHHARLKECEPRLFVGELVGAVGTQASLGPKARQVEEGVMRILGLGVPDISWAPARDRFAEYAGILNLIGGTIGKIGNELFNMQRNEFAEVEEGFTEGKLGSSTMPHKRNPVFAENLPCIARGLRASANMMSEAMIAEHERDGISWKTEWKAMPECCLIAGALLFQCAGLLRGLRVDKAAMMANLDRMRGYLLSERVMLELGEKVGKQNAHEWIYEASMHGIENRLDFAEAMRRHPEISRVSNDADITRMTDPSGYLGEAGASVDRVLARSAAWLGE
ncbi:adenylosuccinate lyase [Muricoccus pecuniae]|uniref:Adenylosuccinate lyase n=1 Tax=Muricoccus pecuniae TaxID=693023 RepID=A0A840YF82_9PROT|nr:adenylosuccinate lyase [Roseomonas pecuniae]MBB5693152.1 adenylosuccinate lyase [Roseomonas pecuniae]